MDVILKQDVPNLGHADDVVSVKSGFGRNYLIPQKMAILATPSAKKAHAEIMKQRAHKLAMIKEQAEELGKKLVAIELKVGAKTSTTGKIFGSVNTIQLAEAIAKKGFEIDRRTITIKEESVKEVGTYHAVVKLHRDIKVEIPFEVVSE